MLYRQIKTMLIETIILPLTLLCLVNCAGVLPRNPLLREREANLNKRAGNSTTASSSSPSASATSPPKSLLGTLTKETQNALKLLLPSIFTFGDDLLASSGITLDCTLCQTALQAVKVTTHLGQSAFQEIVIDVCIISGIPKEECQGVVFQQAPYVIQALQSCKELNGYTGELMCNSVLDACPSFSPKNVSLLFPPLSRIIDDYPVEYQDASTNKGDFLSLLHISDIHYDPNYLVGSEANCDYALCCEKITNPLSGSISHPASQWGEFLCDTPKSLIANFIDSFQSVSGLHPDLSIFTGDIAPHNVWYNNETTLKEAYQIFDLLKKLPSDLYSTIGNHDTTPLNLFQPAGLVKSNQKPTNNWIFNSLSNIWSDWLTPNAVTMLETTQGVYSVRPKPGLKIINMNTNDCYSLNVYIYFNDASEIDPNGQLQWIVNELADSESRNEAVWLMSHVPPGNSDCIIPWSNAFQKIVERYSTTIKAQFYGHTHFDEFAVQYNHDKTLPIGFQLWAPSLTPYSNLNAGYRIYKIDPNSFEIMDSLTYFADISNSSHWDQQPIWQVEYSARDYYPEWPKHAPLNATFWDHVVFALERDNKLFEKYYFRRSKSSIADDKCTTQQCKDQLIKNLRAGNSKDKYYPPIIPNTKSLTDAAKKVGDGTTPAMYNRRRCAH